MSAPRRRQYRRATQACDNCRRKKIRCPGERPQCSACSRLRQHCSFVETASVSEQSTSQVDPTVSSRLEQLEDKLDNLISRVVPQSMQETTPSSTSERPNQVLSFSAVTPQQQSLSTPVSVDLRAKAIGFYFRHIHRQPLWLFDDPLQDLSDELIHAIMALFSTYYASSQEREGVESPGVYYKAARTSVMLTIAQGSMTIQSSQTLCLLAYYNFIIGDVTTAGFDISIAKSMLQLVPDNERDPVRLLSLQAKSRVFWSIQFLSYSCGAPVLLPSVQQDVDTPQLLTVEARDPLTKCIPVPRAVETGVHETLPDVWAQSHKLCSLWTELRLYVARCVEGRVKYPWHPESDYTKLCSQVLDIEMYHPVHLSYNRVKFPSISAQDAHTNRSDLLPWVRIQVAYHAIHCVLNHPCLYTSMAETPRERLGGNTFWRASCEKALRHCTWISRLIRTANEKGLKIVDPFLAQAAAIACTLHLYWARTSDTRLKASSLENLDICRKLVKQMAACWPICKAIDTALDHFIESIERPLQINSETASPAAVKTSLIWILLDMAAPQFPNYRDQTVNSQTVWATSTEAADDEAVPESEMNTPPTDMRESTTCYATPPRWMMEGTQAGSQMEVADRGLDETVLASVAITNDHNTTYDLAWGAWENLGPIGESLYMNVEWWDMNQF
ncbi:unnamed protein product [Fusarium venenatum]|uniref:Zn(2)-C6 fungal-type domain-containing protein n=1 Tax=Fusarium venenatum TaxID=56646 RepID=A0A2L2SXG3_9HYPO|nr:uncharacterized protein FVRRES_05815 [Fusarium venenatum]KAH6992860.1 hypothetical protein EDB82DRAFT_444575 [Fusarium venenatum]CEI61379.1 unnamed protein product [Fusarium venenatum]